MRMPEQHHYSDGRLNIGYVYTDIAKDKIEIVTADADYLKKNALMAFRRENLENVALKSVFRVRPNDARNYFGPDFRKVLYDISFDFWNLEHESTTMFSIADLAAMRGEDDMPTSLKDSGDDQIEENRRRVRNVLRLDVKNINVPIPKNIHFQNEVQSINVHEDVKFARTASEIDRVFISFIAGYLHDFENKNNPADKLAGYLLETLADLFGIFDTDAKKVVLYNENKPKFDRLIRLAIERYKQIRDLKKLKASASSIHEFSWEVPQERIYVEETHHIETAQNHALLPFIELNQDSTPERRFVAFLEQNSENIDWWYKNGDKGRQHYAVSYTDLNNFKDLFYVDFVIRLKNGKILLFDTKSPGSEPLRAHLKHNALIAYILEENAKGANLMGGVIVEEGLNWLWSKHNIENTTDLTGWDIFDPKNI